VTDPTDEYGDLDETTIFQALDDHEVEYVVVGGSAAILWGAHRATRDVDCVARQTTENYHRLCDALRQMGNPRLRIEGVDDEAAAELSRQLLHPDFFARTAASTWRTDSGSIDVLSDIPGLDGQPVPYGDLRARATFAPTGELRIPVASLADIIDSKTRANRAKDRDALSELHELRRRHLGGDP
jgi:nucleotidyltransferase AbiEii toxin of type IV toxin-antitoxin system